jgi:aspartyl aminopeptidase
LFAISVGGKYVNGNGVAIVGAHTDSPCLKLKLISKKVKSGFLEVGVECYGGGIWHTWFDRDLSIAGRVLVRKNGKVQHRLVQINKPLLRIPNLAIHLNRETNEKFSPNKESHLVP